MKGKHLISCDNWFYAPDGKQYKSAWGEVEIIADSFLGIKTNVRSSNWYAKVGNENNYIIIAGCQIHYAVRCENKPNAEDVEDYTIKDNIKESYIRPSNIYIAE